MRDKKRNILLFIVLLASLFLSACAGLLNEAEKAVGGDYGPTYSTQQHQTRTFEALWSDLKDTYIYYDSADVNWDTLHENYTGRIQAGMTDEEFSAMLHELETKLPTGALVYQSRSERLDTDTQDLSTYEGIGAIISFQAKEVPHIVILDVIAGSPAEKAGLKPHDSIFEIDGNPVLPEEGLTVVNRVRGPAGTTVTLNVKTPGKPERSIEVTRGKLSSSGKLKTYQVKGTQYGYILFPPVSYTNMYDDVVKSLQTFTTNQKLEGLILDLRVAGSSNAWPLQDLLTLFYDGKIGEFYNSAKQTQPVSVKGQDQYSSQTVPLIILIGKNTSGSPEILSATLQAGKRAMLIGETTPGAIESTSPFYLPDGSRIFIETTSFRLPDGEEFGNSGIKPNVAVEAGWDAVLPNADPVLDAAIEALKNEQK
jgi:carboxyl-terminal processing protease